MVLVETSYTDEVDISVIVVTKGRPGETKILLQRLAMQDLVPQRVFVVGTCEADLPTVPETQSFEYKSWVAAKAGTTIQRNEGLIHLAQTCQMANSIVVFFDDDFRPRTDWLSNCASIFAQMTDVNALTGVVLADGIKNRPGFSEDEAISFLQGTRPPLKCWAAGGRRDIDSLYGCNMAFRGSVFGYCRFDEELIFYGWQEDRDIAGQVRANGRVILEPTCVGVHLASGGGRTSGLKFGYSQIANMIYLKQKGTVELHVTLRFLSRALLSNIAHAIHSAERSVYASRLLGNMLAISDLLRGCCRPRRIADLS